MPEPVPTPSRGAVFLSYASQDATAVERIAGALRAAGVEVWFDRNELVGGDAWDQKIRRQIKECALFVPVISANTNARAEGYFRLEWKLAVDRSHLIADDAAFLLPVVIDDTSDAAARVPDKFREVQWTRLNVKDTPETLATRVAKLLGGTPDPARPRPAERGEDAAPPRESSPSWLRHSWAVFGLLIGLAYALRPLWPGRGAAERPAASPPAAPGAAKTTPSAEARQRAITLINSLDAIADDFMLAEEIATRAVDKSPADPDAVTTLALVESYFLLRNFDFSDARTALAKRYGERAVQLAPDNPEALYALAIYLVQRGRDPARAETLLRRACELAPAEPRYWRELTQAMSVTRPAEALSLAEQNVARFPRDALTHYELSFFYRNQRHAVEWERELDATIALAPVANAIDWKARAALMHGDLAGMRRWLERVPARTRVEERTVLTSVAYAMYTGDLDYGLRALQGCAQPWFMDTNNYGGPKALLMAVLLEQQGKTGLARVQYEAARADVRRRAEASPADASGRVAEVWILRGLGELDEARAVNRVALEALRRPVRPQAATLWIFDVIPTNLLLGERATALALMREAAETAEGRDTIRLRMKLDPRMKPWRDDPEIAALLQEPELKK